MNGKIERSIAGKNKGTGLPTGPYLVVTMLSMTIVISALGSCRRSGGPQLHDVKQLYGIESLQMTEGQVALINSRTSGWIMTHDGVPTNRALLKVGDSMTVGDGRHVSIVYKLKEIHDDGALFEETELFLGRSFGGDDVRHTRVVKTRWYDHAIDFP